MRTMDKKLLRQRIKALGKNAKTTVGAKAGVSASYISKLMKETTTVLPRVGEADKLADALGVGFDDLFPKIEDAA